MFVRDVVVLNMEKEFKRHRFFLCIRRTLEEKYVCVGKLVFIKFDDKQCCRTTVIQLIPLYYYFLNKGQFI